MNTPTYEPTQLGELLDSFVASMQDATDALVMSSDGLLAAMSSGLSRTAGDQLAAAALGIIGLARSGIRRLGGIAVNQVIVELEHGYMYLMPMSAGASLIVIATVRSDVGSTGYEMSLLADRIAELVADGQMHISPTWLLVE